MDNQSLEQINKDGSMTPKMVLSLIGHLKEKRANWEQLWQECADYFLPNKNNITVQRSAGEKRNLVLLDNTGIMSAVLLSGFLHGQLTNPDSKFFGFTSGDSQLDMSDEVRLFFEKCEQVIMNILNNSNFQGEVHEYYIDLVNFGTAAMDVEEDSKQVVKFFTRFIKEIYIQEDANGQISEYFRSFEATAKELVQLFGSKNMPEEVTKCYNSGDKKKFEVVHAVYPKRKENPGVMTYVSQYIVPIPQKEPWEASKKGFRDMPTAISRWEKGSGDEYGRSPAMNALPDMKTLNKMTETVLKGAEKAVDPVVQMPDDGFITTHETVPGGILYYRAGTNDRVEEVFKNTRIDFGQELLVDRRTRIRESFFVDQLKLREADRMTTVEVNARKEEGAVLMAPVLARQRNEFLRVVIDRVFDIASRKNLLPDPPEVLKGKKVDVKYTSMIAKSQRLGELSGILRTMEAIAPIASFDPTVTDNFDGDGAARFIAQGYGYPQELLRNVDARDAIREQRAEAQQAQEQQQAQMSQAETIGTVAPALAALNKSNQG